MSALDVAGLKTQLDTPEGVLRAVDGVDFEIRQGECFALVGESGCGKSMTALSILRLLPEVAHIAAGEVRLDGQDLLALPEAAMRAVRGKRVAMIFQEPSTALNPVLTVGRQVVEVIERHGAARGRAAKQRALELLEAVGIPDAERRYDEYPFQLSGGLRQRAMIAIALSCRPSVLLADEPTTALDVSVQIQIVLLLRQLQKDLGMAVIFVTHDVGVAVEIADRLAVMYAGRFVETGPTRAVIRSPRHPYTQGLLASTVRGAIRGQPLEAIPGMPPDLGELPSGCSFALRCRHVEERCHVTAPGEHCVAPDHTTRCLRVADGSLPGA